MAVHIELHPAAVAEAAQAHSWYLERSRAVAEAFFRELENALTRIAVTPRPLAEVHGRHPSVSAVAFSLSGSLPSAGGTG